MKVSCHKHALREMKNRSHQVHAFIHIKVTEQPKDVEKCYGFACKEKPVWLIMSAMEGIQFEEKMKSTIDGMSADSNDDNNLNIEKSSDDQNA